MINIRLLTWSRGLFGLVTFLVCIAYVLIAPQAFHMHRALQAVLPGFRWLTAGRFVIGLVESFLGSMPGSSSGGSIMRSGRDRFLLRTLRRSADPIALFRYAYRPGTPRRALHRVIRLTAYNPRP